MLDTEKKENQRSAAIRQLDPLLKDYQSEYHYLFTRVYRAYLRQEKDLGENSVLPNIARRVLEAFLDFREPGGKSLWNQLEGVAMDSCKRLRICRFLNTYSHSLGVGQPAHDPELLAEAPAILKDMLDLIKSEDEKHYSAMEKIAKEALNIED